MRNLVASFHVTPYKEWFSWWEVVKKGSVCLSRDCKCNIAGMGDVQLSFLHGFSFTLKNVCHVPNLTKRLIITGGS